MKKQEQIERGKAAFGRIMEREQKDLSQGRWVAGTMLVAGAFICIRFLSIGIIFLAVGVLLFVMNQSARQTMQRQLAKMGDPDAFYAALGGPEARTYSDFGLILTPDFAVREGRRTELYRFDEMEKFEVGLAGAKLKKLFLTDRAGKRHEIAQTVHGDGKQEIFDEVYEYVRKQLPAKKER